MTSGRPAKGPISIYVASPEGETGKSTIALGIVHRLSAVVPRVGVFRPIARRENTDYILELLLASSSAGASPSARAFSYTSSACSRGMT